MIVPLRIFRGFLDQHASMGIADSQRLLNNMASQMRWPFNFELWGKNKRGQLEASTRFVFVPPDNRMELRVKQSLLAFRTALMTVEQEPQ